MIRVTRKINKLKFNVGFDGEWFIKFDKMIFFGPETPKKLYKYYWLLNHKTRKRLPIQCLKIAQDIIIRYIEAGLGLAKSKKEAFYKIKKTDIVAEAGAYQGFYIMRLAQKAKKVYAIEPYEDNLKYLRLNTKNFDNVEIIPKGVWHKKDIQAFYKKSTDEQSGSIMIKNNEKITFHVDTLDNLIKEEIDFMVIQLNGAEKNVILGMKKLRPKNLAITSRINRQDAEDIQWFLDFMRYETKLIDNQFIYAKIINTRLP
ncbi:MAG: FkbM family methyltransferase [Promethearchaeota archaeon]